MLVSGKTEHATAILWGREISIFVLCNGFIGDWLAGWQIFGLFVVYGGIDIQQLLVLPRPICLTKSELWWLSGG